MVTETMDATIRDIILTKEEVHMALVNFINDKFSTEICLSPEETNRTYHWLKDMKSARMGSNVVKIQEVYPGQTHEKKQFGFTVDGNATILE